MRIDKYLWCTRYLKTRNQASIACKKGQVKINDFIAKPSREVYIGDTISLRKNQINYVLRVNDIPPNRVGAKLVDIYRTDLTPKSEFETQELLKYSKDYYRKKGTGQSAFPWRSALSRFSEPCVPCLPAFPCALPAHPAAARVPSPATSGERCGSVC